MLIEPAIFLRKIRNDFFIAGGKIVAKDFRNLDEVLSLEENTIFNCTGLGAKALFGDEEMEPAKGQLVFMPPDEAVDYLCVARRNPARGIIPARRLEPAPGGGGNRTDYRRQQGSLREFRLGRVRGDRIEHRRCGAVARLRIFDDVLHYGADDFTGAMLEQPVPGV